MQEVLEKLEQEIKSVKRACRLGKSVLEEGLEVKTEAQELHAKFSALIEALTHASKAVDEHYASLEDDTALEEMLILLKRVRARINTPLASLEQASTAKEALDSLASLEKSILDVEGVLASLKEHPTLSTPTSPKATPQMAKKYCPQSKEELKKLVADESVHLGEIDISKIADLSWVFCYADSILAAEPKVFRRANFEGLETWDTSHVTNMEYMFYRAIFFNYDISSWNVSRVQNMDSMFHGCEIFNQPLSSWNVSRVEKMAGMFLGCENFNQPLNTWDVSRVEAMGWMFQHCEDFNQPLDNWDVSRVENMNYMFHGCTSFDQPLKDWNVSRVEEMHSMFKDCKNFNQSLNDWDVSKVKSMRHMFSNCYNFNQNLDSWHVLSTASTKSMFDGCTALKTLPTWYKN
ncbi:hypothetical protein HBZC1_01980 [Helicobacter bizzozeronii CIII-1]|uniref:Chitinase n=1 Tax=Helicobacter bizzozeronii (strain CIII-1) TaxID=1002804 RepID=F8KQ01_HELBC|nr:BspA family leucine-rich repeat surface protein [Helicobacter bizzozeronii]CCB79184.1 hypothetical protein HBZC1_01980 [Helicobacter bizzozeronii CIII-1]